jgi:hypothetical protein
MTDTLSPALAVEDALAPPVIERTSRAKVAAMILTAHVQLGLAYPTSIRFVVDEIPAIYFDLETVADFAAWAAYFLIPQAKWWKQLYEPTNTMMHGATRFNWYGWSQVRVEAAEPAGAASTWISVASGEPVTS